MHVRFLLFCVCWVWYYTYFVEYYLDTYAMLLVCSIVPCPAVSRVFYGIWMFHPSILRSLSCWISLSSVIFDGTYIHLCIDKKEFMHMFLCVLDYIRWACVLRCQCYAFRLQDCLLFAWVLTGMYLSSIATMKIHNIGVPLLSLFCPSSVLLLFSMRNRFPDIFLRGNWPVKLTKYSKMSAWELARKTNKIFKNKCVVIGPQN